MQNSVSDRWLLSTRITGILLILISIVQFLYFTYSNNPQHPMFAVVFLCAIFTTVISTVISVINSWFYDLPKLYKVKLGKERTVGVIIPTRGEPVEMVLATLHSVLSQNWPRKNLVVVISDDARNTLLKHAVLKIIEKNKNVVYYTPPTYKSGMRLGDAKAGNLNAALTYLLRIRQDIDFIETRDADDLVGTPDFLRLVVGSLISNKELSFVQTIKRAHVSKGDPFLNQEILFYERTMMYRSSVNSIFPCGSGLVWRISDLLKIKCFPTWNLVEDLHSGYESLKLGGKGEFLPIVGAIGQSAPEDIPNYYKQRGTWAIDALRLFFWKNALFAKQLNFWQKLQFFELGYSYLLSLIMLVFIFSITTCLGYSVCPTESNSPYFLLVSGLFIIILEAYNIARARGVAYEEIWKIRHTWIGLLHVFAISAIKALFYGPNKKPSYEVTRKHTNIGFYWKEILIQLSFVFMLVFAMAKKLTHFETIQTTDIILFFWSFFLIYGLSKVIRNSFHGVYLKFNVPSVRFLSLSISRNLN